MKFSIFASAIVLGATLLGSAAVHAEGPGSEMEYVDTILYFCDLLDANGARLQSVSVRADDKDLAIAKATAAAGMKLNNGDLIFNTGGNASKDVIVRKVRCEESGLE